MSNTRHVRCDGCGKTLVNDETPLDEAGLQQDDSFSAQINTTDRFSKKDKTYRWRSAGWDFCLSCARKAYDALSAIGKPDHGNDLFGDTNA